VPKDYHHLTFAPGEDYGKKEIMVR